MAAARLFQASGSIALSRPQRQSHITKANLGSGVCRVKGPQWETGPHSPPHLTLCSAEESPGSQKVTAKRQDSPGLTGQTHQVTSAMGVEAAASPPLFSRLNTCRGASGDPEPLPPMLRAEDTCLGRRQGLGVSEAVLCGGWGCSETVLCGGWGCSEAVLCGGWVP